MNAINNIQLANDNSNPETISSEVVSSQEDTSASVFRALIKKTFIWSIFGVESSNPSDVIDKLEEMRLQFEKAVPWTIQTANDNSKHWEENSKHWEEKEAA